MAITDIQATVLRITGVTPTANSVEDAQRFVVSSVPKDLLKWAASETVPATHGGDNDPQQVTIPSGTDSIISVRRDSYVAQEVGIEDRGFIANSNSLHLATNTFPKYFVADANRIIVKPDPDSTYKIYITYVDSSNIDDDSDLRNAVIYHTSSHEFTKLATGKVTDWSDLTPPIAPSSPNFGDDLTISTPAPVAPASPSFAYTNASVSDIVKPIISISDMASMTESAPTFTPPVMGSLDFADTEDLITNEEDSEMLSSRVQEIQAKIGEFSAKLGETQLRFNRENSVYQQDIQRKVQNLQKDTQEAVKNAQNDITVNSAILQKDIQIELQNAAQDFQQDVQEYSAKIQRYSAELNQYQQDIQIEVQVFVNTLNKETQEYQNKLSLYNSDSQKYQAEIGEKTAKVGSATQNAAYYSKEADKYYQWANAEVQIYIQNNSKIINKTIAAQSAQQQRR